MRSLFNPLFLAIYFSYAFNKLFLYLQLYSFPFLKNYLSDCLVMPVLLSLALFLMRTFVVKNEVYTLSIFQTAFATIYAGVVFEFLGPKVFTGKTSDWYDLIAYSGGAIFFMVFMNKKKANHA